MPSLRFAARLAHVARLAPAALLCLAACSGDRTPAPATTTRTAAAPATPATPGESAAAVPGLTPLPPDTALEQLRGYRLTSERLHKWARAQHALNDLTSRDTSVLRAIDQGEKPHTIDQMIARIDAAPGVRQTMRDVDYTTRDYVLTMLALQQGMQGYAAKRAGKLEQPLPGAAGANVEFVERNLADIQKIFAAGRQ